MLGMHSEQAAEGKGDSNDEQLAMLKLQELQLLNLFLEVTGCFRIQRLQS